MCGQRDSALASASSPMPTALLRQTGVFRAPLHRQQCTTGRGLAPPPPAVNPDKQRSGSTRLCKGRVESDAGFTVRHCLGEELQQIAHA
eukprot:5713678-Pleurochrysis_carterae.AAC.1